MPAQMDMHRRVPFFGRGRNKHPVAHDPCIVDDDMQVTKFSDRRINDPLRRVPIGDVFIIRQRLAARCLDLVNHSVRR